MIRNLKLKLFRTSVKENFNVDKGIHMHSSNTPLLIKLLIYAVFEYLASKFMEKRTRETHARSKGTVQAAHIGQNLMHDYRMECPCLCKTGI